MPLPSDFPPPPRPPQRRPPASEPAGSKAWIDYATDHDRFATEARAFLVALRDYLDTL